MKPIKWNLNWVTISCTKWNYSPMLQLPDICRASSAAKVLTGVWWSWRKKTFPAWKSGLTFFATAKVLQKSLSREKLFSEKTLIFCQFFFFLKSRIKNLERLLSQDSISFQGLARLRLENFLIAFWGLGDISFKSWSSSSKTWSESFKDSKINWLGKKKIIGA